MSEIEREILNALTALEASVATVRVANPKPNLQSLFNRIDELTEQLPADASPDLVHYLRRKSYEKARLWLLGRSSEAPPGSCGR